MKTIFRYANIAVLMAAFIVLGAVAGIAQDPCADAEGQTALGDKFRKEFADKTIEGRKTAIETGKQFLEKYGSCPSAKELADYLTTQIPKLETALKALQDKKVKDDLIARFNNGLNTKSWDEVYSAGKEILAKYPDEFRDVELALGSIGYDESYKNNNFKYNDDTLKYARMSIADLEGGKTFSASFGVPKDFVYKSKENALGWMNMIIGYITGVPQKNRSAALPFLFKAAQSTSTTPDSTAKNPIPYEQIGWYYFDELDKLTTEIKAMVADQKDTDTAEIAKQKVDAIKAKVALSNGTAERAMDAFSRAYNLSTAKAYKDKMRTNVLNAYKLRFTKEDGVDAWIAATVKKPFVDPTTPVTPISDTEPPAPATTTTTTTTTTPAVKPGPPAAKPPPTPAKPVSTTMTKPAAGSKPQAKLKKPAVKKKGA